jgi:hypothetical protein
MELVKQITTPDGVEWVPVLLRVESTDETGKPFHLSLVAYGHPEGSATILHGYIVAYMPRKVVEDPDYAGSEGIS